LVYIDTPSWTDELERQVQSAQKDLGYFENAAWSKILQIPIKALVRMQTTLRSTAWSLALFLVHIFSEAQLANKLNTGHRDKPLSVNLYSTFGGTSGYTFL